MRDTVKINHISHDMMISPHTITVQGSGHATEFIVACRDIAQAIIRDRYRWWFQDITAHLDEQEATQVSDMEFRVSIQFGD